MSHTENKHNGNKVAGRLVHHLRVCFNSFLQISYAAQMTRAITMPDSMIFSKTVQSFMMCALTKSVKGV